jgi:2-deoxy-D-gluconate 3-dehydrogenase
MPDILVNNAGVIRRANAVDHSDEDRDTVLQVNLKSLCKLSQCMGRALIESKRPGKIINLASLLSFQGGITVPALCRFERSGGAAHEGPGQRMGFPRN